jgi:hypothetical protein
MARPGSRVNYTIGRTTCQPPGATETLHLELLGSTQDYEFSSEATYTQLYIPHYVIHAIHEAAEARRREARAAVKISGKTVTMHGHVPRGHIKDRRQVGERDSCR